jgi:uncharacterized protein (TIGR02284 family)
MPATRTMDEVLETLESGRIGFARGAERLERDGYSSLAAMFRDVSDERARFAAELRRIEDHTEDSGPLATVVGAAHRGWTVLRDAVAGGDPDAVLSVADRCEDQARRVYEHALVDDALAPSTREVLQRQCVALKAAHDRVRFARRARRP